jgi:hypothetical protein
MKINITQHKTESATAFRKVRWLLLFILISSASMAESMRGFYVNGFNTILGNSASETSLLNYAQSNGYNYLCLYSMASLDLTNATVKSKLASFISRAKTQYGITQVGAAGEVYSFFASYIIPYNAGRTANEKIDVLNFEFEFWIASSIANQYCAQYLTPNGLSCDSAGAFAFAKTQFTLIDNAAAANGLMSEVYFGWPNKGQMQWFAQRADRILLHAYRTSDSDIYTYTKQRLTDIASINSPVNVMIIFSSESDYMGPWLQSHAISQPYETYSTAFAAETGSWKTYIRLIGYQWFKYSTMPPTTTVSLSASISAGGPVTFCSGGSVVLSVTSGTADTYQWTKNLTSISGATGMTYTATSSGDYAVKITKAGSSATSSSITVNASASLPQPTISANGPLSFCPGGSVMLTSSSITGNKWSTNETTQSITVNAAGNYSVTVSSGGCTASSAQANVAVATSASTPVISLAGSNKICPGTGVVLTSSEAGAGGYIWSTGETTRSIVARSAGAYWVRTGTSACYAQSSEKNIIMKSAPATPIISISGSTNLGTGGSVTLTSTYSHAYLWTNGSTSKYITVNMAGNYSVTVTGNNGCKSTSAGTVITSATCTPPSVPVITSGSPNNILESGSSIVLKSSASAGYLWSSGQTTQSISVTAPGVYTVRSYNSGSCFSTSLPVTIYTFDVIARGSWNSEADAGLVSMISYPNPAHGPFSISFNSEREEACMLNVYDLSGRILMTKNISAATGMNIIDMDSETLPPGIYLLRMDGVTLHGRLRFIVE